MDRGAPIIIGRKLYAYDVINESLIDYSEENDLQNLGAYELITCSLLDLVKNPEIYYKDIKWKRTTMGSIATALLFSIDEEQYDLDRKDEVIRELMECEYFDEIDNIDYMSDYSVWSLYHEKQRLEKEKYVLEKRLKKIINPSSFISLSDIISKEKVKSILRIFTIAACIVILLMIVFVYVLFSGSSQHSANDRGTSEMVVDSNSEISENPNVTQTLESKYDLVAYDEGIYQVLKGDYYGLCDNEGNEICKPQFSFIGYVENGLMEVTKGDKFGCINTEGKIIIPCAYDAINIEDGVIECTKGNKTLCYDMDGKLQSKRNE